MPLLSGRAPFRARIARPLWGAWAPGVPVRWPVSVHRLVPVGSGALPGGPGRPGGAGACGARDRRREPRSAPVAGSPGSAPVAGRTRPDAPGTGGSCDAGRAGCARGVLPGRAGAELSGRIGPSGWIGYPRGSRIHPEGHFHPVIRRALGREGHRGGRGEQGRGGVPGSRSSRARRPLRGRGRAEAAAGGSRGPVIPGGPDLPPLPDRRPGPVRRGLRARSRG